MPVEDNAALILGEAQGRTAPWAMLHVTWTEWKNLFSLEVYCRTAKLQVDGLVRSYGPQTLTDLPDAPGARAARARGANLRHRRSVLGGGMGALRRRSWHRAAPVGRPRGTPTTPGHRWRLRTPRHRTTLGMRASVGARERAERAARRVLPSCPGGLGTRLGETVRDTPKPLLEVAGEPFLMHQLRLLARYRRTPCRALRRLSRRADRGAHRAGAVRDRDRLQL